MDGTALNLILIMTYFFLFERFDYAVFVLGLREANILLE